MSIFNTTFKLLFAVSFFALLFNPPRAFAVSYRVSFDATWSAGTHPSAYPGGAHFSSLIGTTHNDQVTFWDTGGIATSGIEDMAETGNPSQLSSEYAAAGADSDTLITAGGIGSPSSISTTFNISSTHSLVTLVTMIAPSPDWFVGVSGVDLKSGGNWMSELVVDLYAYDAGTDSGSTFTAANNDTNPQDPIALLGAPFTGTPALGTFTFTLRGDFDQDGNIDGADFLKWQRGETTIPYSASDLDDWYINFGTSAPAVAAAIIPEPMTWSMMLLGISIMIHLRRKHLP
jgi:hypothetical protein